MTSPPPASFLDFFVLEASEYVEQIDALLLRAAAAGPDADSLQRVARALRGSATMAKLPSFAELASAVESVGRALRQGAVGWDANLQGALTAAVDDLKILVRAARTWSAAEEQSALRRIADLGQFVQNTGVGLMSTPSTGNSGAYFASEATNIAAGLELLTTRPDDSETATNVLNRVRAMRGVAGVREIAGLGEVAEAAENALQAVERGETISSPEQVNLLRVAAELLRTIATGVSTGQQITSESPQYTGFLAALDAVRAEDESQVIVPIASLYFSDGGPHVVTTSPNPPTTAPQRFRMELVSLGEHLHRSIDEVRAATDNIQREHAQGELGRALRAIRATAASFGQKSVATTVEQHLARTGQLDVSALDAIAGFAGTISPAASAPTPAIVPAVPQAPPPPRPTMPKYAAPPPTPPVARAIVSAAANVANVASQVAASALDSTIAFFDSLAGERFAEPADLGDDTIPVDALLYRGRAALDRAIELRDSIRRANQPPSPEVLEELYDLVELARVD